MGREHHHWGEVIALSEYRVQEPPQIALVRTYWEGLRGDRLAPPRSEVDPHAFSPALGHAIILDQIASGHARFRVAGMQVCDLMGMEVRGMPLAALFLPSARDALAELLGELFTGRTALRLGLRADHGLGRPALSGQLLLLPLTDRSGAPNRALGCLVTEGETGFPPRRFQLDGVIRSQIGSTAPATAPEPEPAPAGFAEPAAGFTPRPYLRLVKADDGAA